MFSLFTKLSCLYKPCHQVKESIFTAAIIWNNHPFTLMNHSLANDWQSAQADVFWNDIARFDHVLQLYENDVIFIDTLIGFVESTIRANQIAIVIATNSHLTALEAQLENHGHTIEKLIADHIFIPVSAEDTLDEVFVDDSVDENRFMQVLSNFLDHAKHNQKKVRVFGEMVALLWAQGNKDAALQLEHVANRISKQEAFIRYCAYPKELFTADGSDKSVCDCHSKIISGSEQQLDKVTYRDSLR